MSSKDERVQRVAVTQAPRGPSSDDSSVGIGSIQAMMAAGGNLAMVQLSGGGGARDVHAAAEAGVAGGGGALPHMEAIQSAFGKHDVSGVKAHTGPAAEQATSAMGATAYATGNSVALGSGASDLHTVAHEAAHVVQQRAGVSLSGGVGQTGDRYEQHADAVADKVVKGQSAEAELDKMAGGGGAAGVQKKAVQRAPAPPAPAPMTEAEAKAAADAKAVSCADISAPFARLHVGKTKAAFDSEFAALPALQSAIITAFIDAGDAKTQTQAVGRPDPIATQKFQDIDQESHLEDASLKGRFYTALAGKMKDGTFSDRTRTFPAMKSAAGRDYNFQGKQITPDRITPLSTRNHGVQNFFDKANAATNAQIDLKIEEPLRRVGKPPAEIAEAKKDRSLRKKAYYNLLKGGLDPLASIDKTGNITDWGTWYHPGALVKSVNPDPDLAFTDMMTLGALQPEWYAEGTCVMTIDRTGAAGRICRKPTAFDGLMSALWVARNMGENDYGCTGGGAGEFLESAVPWADVKAARAVIPTDTFQAELAALSAAAPAGSTPTEEMLRGNMPKDEAGAATGRAYTSVIGSTVREQNTPGAAPTLPGAARPASSAAPAAPAVAPGGAYSGKKS